ncbi:MAG: hydroxyacid dehydrogenase [Planctomycetia bacterium]|nr:hydroxyacid dehydrogenase [Planctomycetia bacterium]
MTRPKGLFILGAGPYEKIYTPPVRAEIDRLVEICAPPMEADEAKENVAAMADADVLFSGWGAPMMDAEFIASAAKLKIVFYGSGSIKHFVTDAFWKRGVRITSAWAANAVPVAEYALSQILFCLKLGWHFALGINRQEQWVPKFTAKVPGAFGTTVGIISLSRVGRHLCCLLKAFDMNVIAYDPYADSDDAEKLGVRLVDLDEVFRTANVVSLHAPWIEETVGMLTGAHFEAMKPNAAFINTARGAIVREAEMIEVLKKRPDLFAILDVTHPEPPEAGSPLYTLPNVILTPHISGSMDGECARMGWYMVEEVKRYLAGEPLKWEITRDMIPRLG